MKYLILFIFMLYSSYSYSQGNKKITTEYSNGLTEEVKNFDKKSRKTGEWIRYYQNGNISHVGYFVKGKKNGTWKTYDLNGRLVYLITFKNNKRINVVQWSETSGLIVKN